MSSSNISPTANANAARWFGDLISPAESSVFAPTGAWPLLAMLASGADKEARRELEEAIGLPAEEAANAAQELLSTLRSMSGVSAALGLWSSADVPLRSDWLPDRLTGHIHELPKDLAVARRRLDAWAAAETDGRIGAMPVTLDEDACLILASGIDVRTTWLQRFADVTAQPSDGPWTGRQIAALTRETTLLHHAAVLESPTGSVTELRILGEDGIDAHLLLGDPTMTPGSILQAGIGVLHQVDNGVFPIRRTTADTLPSGSAGPGLSIRKIRSKRAQSVLDVSVAAFALDVEHDLLNHAELFGLRTASDRSRGHFPGIAEAPLAVASAGQRTVATFGADGFEAAAATATSLDWLGLTEHVSAQPEVRARRVEIEFHQPFGFLAVHRASQLVLVGGWVAEPSPEVLTE